jgi:hypothetical protein
VTVPVKLKDSAAPSELQTFTSTEENYLAYQAGLQLSASANSGLQLTDTGTNYIIGTFTDTSYDDAVGTSAEAGLATTTVTTTVRQRGSTATTSGSDYRVPVKNLTESGQQVIREMNASDLNTLLDRLISRIFTSDYPGSFQLATSAPSADYQEYVSNVMTDTRSDGASLQYNIYRRNAMTAPTKVLPFAIKRSSGRTGTYQGLQLMSDAQVKYSLGQLAKTRIASSQTGVGNYRIFSSAQGNPAANSLSGTWVSKGTATDTRQAIVSANYTRGRVSNFNRTRSSNYQRTSTRTSNRNFSAAYTRIRSSAYARIRTSNYTGNFIGNFLGDYQRTSTRTSNREYQRTSTRTRASNYTGTVSYTGDYSRNFAGNFSTTYVGNYSRATNFTGNFVGSAIGGGSGGFYSVTAGNEYYFDVHEEFGDAGEGAAFNFYRTTIVWKGTTLYAQNAPGSAAGYVGETNTYQVIGGARFDRGSLVSTTTIDAFTTRYRYGIIGLNQNSNNVSFTRSSVGSTSYTRNSIVTSTRTSNRVYQRVSTREVNYSRNFAGNFIGNYSRNFVGDFLGDYQRLRINDSTADFSRNFVGNYSRNFTGNYTGNYARNYAGNFVGDYARNFAGNYARTFTGNYAGSQIGSGNTNIETYTLYVRTA